MLCAEFHVELEPWPAPLTLFSFLEVKAVSLWQPGPPAVGACREGGGAVHSPAASASCQAWRAPPAAHNASLELPSRFRASLQGLHETKVKAAYRFGGSPHAVVHAVCRGCAAPLCKLLLELCSHALQKCKGYLAPIRLVCYHQEGCRAHAQSVWRVLLSGWGCWNTAQGRHDTPRKAVSMFRPQPYGQTLSLLLSHPSHVCDSPAKRPC